MPPFLYRCPNTGNNVQAWADDEPDDDDFTYVQVRCLACAQLHLVNLKTGKVLGSDVETAVSGTTWPSMSTSCEPVLRMPSACQVSSIFTCGEFIGTLK